MTMHTSLYPRTCFVEIGGRWDERVVQNTRGLQFPPQPYVTLTHLDNRYMHLNLVILSRWAEFLALPGMFKNRFMHSDFSHFI